MMKDDPKVLYVNSRSDVEINTYSDTRKYRVGAVIGTSYFPQFDQDMSLHKAVVTSDKQLISMLMTNRIDTFISSPTHVSYLLENENFDSSRIRAEYTLKPGEYSYMAFSKRSPNLSYQTHLESKLAELLVNGDIKT